MSFIREIRRGNRIYLSEVESKRINGKVVQRHIRYIGPVERLPEPVQFRLPRDIQEAVLELAKENRQSYRAYILAVVREHLKSNVKEKKPTRCSSRG